MSRFAPILAAAALHACGSAADALKHAQRDLPGANDYERMGKAFQPPPAAKSRESGDAQSRGDDTPPGSDPARTPSSRQWDPEGSDTSVGPAGSDKTQAPPDGDASGSGSTYLNNGSAACTWQPMSNAYAWQGSCTALHQGAPTLPLPALADLDRVAFFDPAQAAAAKTFANTFRPDANTVSVPMAATNPFAVVLNPGGMGGVAPTWLPAYSAFHPDQGSCGDVTLYHRNATESFAFTVDMKKLVQYATPDDSGPSRTSYRLDLADPVVGWYANLTLSLRTKGSGAPAFDECHYLSGPHARVVWRGRTGIATVVVKDGKLSRVSFQRVTVASPLGFNDLPLRAVPMLGIDDDGTSEATSVWDEVVR